MRKSKKILSVLLTVIMLFSSVTVAFAFMSLYTIKADEKINITIPEDDTVYVKFIPEKTAVYEIKSDAAEDIDPYAYVYDEAENEIAEGDDDDNCNFCFEVSLVGGKTYYIIVGEYENRAATIGLTVTTGHIHENLTEVPATSETCTQDGATYGLQCTDCGIWITEPEIIPAHHTDENADRVCDICSEAAILASEDLSSGVKAVLYNCGDLVVSGAGDFSVYSTDDIYANRKKIKKVFLGKYITSTTTYFHSNSFEGFIVDEENATYKSDSAMALYSKDGATLLVFPEKSPVEEYTVPDGVTEIYDNAFSYNETIKKVNLPESLRTIGLFAFYDCAALESISFPSSIEKIGENAFSGCKKITNITIPQSVTYLGSDAFDYNRIENAEKADDCIYLGDILVKIDSSESPINILNIREGTRMMYRSGYLWADTVIIPASLKYNEEIFSDFDIKKFIVNENSPYYSSDENGVLFNKDKTVLSRYPTFKEDTEYTVPQGVKEISYGAFQESNIATVNLPDSLEKIDDYAFYFCDISQINLPAGLKEIGESAFYSSSNSLKSVVVPESVEHLGDCAFDCDYVAILNPGCVIDGLYYSSLIIGYNGSTAEKYASENKRAFATLGNADGTQHGHIYMPTIITPVSCQNEGVTSYSCPCGNTQTYTVTIEKEEHNWWPMGDELICHECGETQPLNEYYECDCECHEERNKVQEFFFKIKLFFWKLFKRNEFCYCGIYHW